VREHIAPRSSSFCYAGLPAQRTALVYARMRYDQIAAGFIAAIERCGDVLATNAPPDGSSNESPDRLYVI
jgi:uncharacterized membrane protein